MDQKCDVWRCTFEGCREVFVTRHEWDESKVYCPFCRAEDDVPERLVEGVKIELGGGVNHESESA